MRRSPLRRVGLRAKTGDRPARTSDEYRAAKEQVWRRDYGTCQAAARIARAFPDRPEWHGCAGRLDPHHIIPVETWPDGLCEVTNMIVVCRQHHAWIHHSRPMAARTLGLLSDGRGLDHAPA